MRILLTGGTGFIGSHVLESLSQHGHQVQLLVPEGAQSTLPLPCVTGDIRDLSACRKATVDADTVVHAAGVTGDPALLMPVNSLGTANLVKASVENGVARLIYISTVAVIGADPLTRAHFLEDAPCHPVSLYGRSKWEGEQAVRQAGEHGLAVTILRLASAFGERSPRRQFLSLARRIASRRFVYVGGRLAVCNFVYVEDVAHVVSSLLDCPHAGGVYHLSDTCTLGEFVDVWADEIGVPRPRWEVPEAMAHVLRAVLRVANRIGPVRNCTVFTQLLSLNNQASFASTRLYDEWRILYPTGWRAGVRRLVQRYRVEGLL